MRFLMTTVWYSLRTSRSPVGFVFQLGTFCELKSAFRVTVVTFVVGFLPTRFKVSRINVGDEVGVA